MKSNLRKPAALKFGDTVGIVAPASPSKNPSVIAPAIKQLQQLGFKVKVGRSLRKRQGYLAGSDKERVSDLNTMIRDREVSAILCLRGGYGSSRILADIDYATFKKNPKIFCGFSDITALHAAFLKKTGVCTFHGPNLLSLFKDGVTNESVLASFLKCAMDKSKIGDVFQAIPLKKGVSLRNGSATGTLVGGNLAVLTSLLGTDFLPSFDGVIVYLEDVNEPPYKIDRMLTQFLLSGLWRKVKGFAIGTFLEKENIKAVFLERLKALGVPVVYGLPFGHIDTFATIPQGTKAYLNGKQGTLEVLESAVR